MKRVKMEILDLVLKHQYYDAINSGEKTEEYRDTYFWSARFLKVDREGYGYFQKACHGDFENIKSQSNDSCSEFTHLLKQAIKDGFFDYRHYDAVRFHRGYTNTTMTFAIKYITVGMGNPLLGAPTDREVFIIKLGTRLNENEDNL